MHTSLSLAQLPLRFQMLFSLVSLGFIALLIVMLSIQQAFYMRMGHDGMFGTDLVIMLATVAAAIIPFVAGIVMVPRGAVWHRLTVGSVVMIASLLLTFVSGFGLQMAGVFNLFSPLVMAGPSLIGIVASLGGLLVVAVWHKWWLQRTKFFVALSIVVVLLFVGNLAMPIFVDGQPSDLLSLVSVIGFPFLAVMVAYRAMTGLARLQRLFRVILVASLVGMVGVIAVFGSMAISQGVIAASNSSIEQQGAIEAITQWATLSLVVATYISGVWLVRPRRSMAQASG